MPTADGRFKGMSVPAAAWERVFAQKEREFAEQLRLDLEKGERIFNGPQEQPRP